jgi:hypothetical protein
MRVIIVLLSKITRKILPLGRMAQQDCVQIVTAGLQPFSQRDNHFRPFRELDRLVHLDQAVSHMSSVCHGNSFGDFDVNAP